MANVKIVSKKTHEILLEGQKDSLTLSEPSVVLLQVDIKDVNRIEKDGRNVKVTLKSGEVIIISDFFDSNGSGDSSKNTLVFENKDHTLSWINYIDNHGAVVEGVNYSYVDDIEIFLYHDNSVSPWLWAALPAAGATVAIASNSDTKHHSSDDSVPTKPKLEQPSIDVSRNEDGSVLITGKTGPNVTVIITDPNGSTHIVTADKDGNYTCTVPKAPNLDGNYTVVANDGTSTSEPNNKNLESGAPDAPTAKINDAGTEVTGKAERGSTVEIKDKDGNVIGTGKAGADGNYKITVSPPQTNGEDLTVSAKDEAGNVSPNTDIKAPDTTPPEAPTAKVNDAGSEVTGKTEPNAEVTIQDKDGKVIGTGKADAEGNYKITVLPSQTNGDDVYVTAKDESGNVSGRTPAPTPDTTAPDAPTAKVNDAGNEVTGKTEPNAEVTIQDKDGKVIGTGKADAEGNYKITVSPSQTNGDDVYVTAKDKSGNVSGRTPAPTPDTTAPDAPTAKVNDAGSEVTGKTEPNAEVTIQDKDGKVIGTGKADAEGNYKITVLPSQTNGDDVYVTAKDESGNVSGRTPAPTPDTTAPDAPTAKVNDAGNEVTGKTEPNAEVTIQDKDGKVIGTGKADAEGNYKITVSPSQTNGDDVYVTAKDESGNVSGRTPAPTPDTTAPDAPTAKVNDAGNEVTGKTEPNAEVTIQDKDGKVIGTGKVDAEGNYKITVSPSQTNGDDVYVTAKDESGNVSGRTPAPTPDTTAPDAPTAVLNEDGSQITGTGEPGSSIEVKDQDGNVIGTAEVGEDGNYVVELSPAQNSGEDLTVNATDKAGNVSPDVIINTPDTTAPDAPTAVLNEDGSQITGTGEPGSTIEVKDQDGNVIGTAEVGEDGNYVVELSPAQNSGEDLTVNATDKAGNVSPDVIINTPDTTAPDAPTAVLNEDGSQITGTGEPGSSIEVKDQDGNVIGTAEVGEDGNYVVELSPAQNSGEDLTVNATDKAGNVSPDVIINTPDTTAPDAPTAVLNEDGSQITGTGEPGSSIEVKDQDGNVIGTAEVGEDGNYVVELSPAQNSGEDLTVNATDKAGNVSPDVIINTPDTTAPDAPTAVLNEDGSQITGTGEPGSTIEVKDQDGNVIGTAEVGEDGNYVVELSPAQNSGEDLTVNATDKAGNVSPDVIINTPDTTAPDAPTAVLNEDGSQITGTGEPGSTIEVKDQDGNVIGTAEVGEDGNYVVELSPAQNSGEDLTVNATDKAGNVSPDVIINTPDTTAPDAPTAVLNEDGSQITGTGEPGSSIEVKDQDGNVIGTAEVGEDGNYVVELSPAQNSGEDLTVNATDKAGNVSPDVIINTPDTTAPDAPTAVLNEDGSQITGTGEPGSTIEVKDQDGNVIGTAEVGEDGNYVVELSPAQNSGEDLTVNATDKAGNVSPDVIINTPDTTAPDAPTAVLNEDGSQITGTGEPGSSIEVKDQDGNVIGTAEVGEDGNYVVELSPAQNSGEDLTVNATDKAGNVSPDVIINTPDTTAPDAPTAVLNEDGSQITGTGEPGSSIEVKDQDGNVIGTAEVGEDGNYVVELSPAQNSGEDLTVNATDKAGNVSPDVIINTPDTTAPDAPTAVLNEDGSQITGTGEPGSSIEVKDQDGNVIGTAEVGEDGNYVVELSPAQNSGEDLTVNATDKAGNVSPDVIINTPDTTAPDAPTAVLNEDGSQITGTGEPGSSIEVKDQDGNVIGTAEVGEDGNYVVELSPAQNSGEDLTVNATDKAGNVSPDVIINTPDTTAPDAPTAVLNEDGSQITGTGEPGSSIEVKDQDGNVIGTAEVGEDGNYVVELSPAQNSGEDLTVNATDKAGNVSPDVIINTPDTTAPEAIIEITGISEDTGVAGDFITRDTSLTIQGTLGALQAGEKAQISVDGGTTWSDLTVSNGTWSYADSRTLTDDSYTYQVRVIDNAGNVGSTDSQIVTVDTTAPNAPTDVEIKANEDDTATIIGKGEPGTTVVVTPPGGGDPIESVVKPDGTFEVSVPGPASDGKYEVITKDDAGNESPKSEVTLDTVAPDVSDLTTTFEVDVDTANGVSGAGYTTTTESTNKDLVTRDATPTEVSGELNRALNPDEMLQISLDGGKTWNDVTLTDTNWRFALPDITYTKDAEINFQLRVRDQANNASELNDSTRKVIVDVTSPDAITVRPDIESVTDIGKSYTFDSTKYGKAEAGSTIALINDVNNNGMWQEGLDKVIATATVNADGTWTITTTLPAGALNVGFVVWDAAGNTSNIGSTTSTGVASTTTGSETIDLGWGGTSDGYLGMNAAAVTLNSSGQWSFLQSIGYADETYKYRLREYTVQDANDTSAWTSSVIDRPTVSNDTWYGGFISGMAYVDLNRDGHMDIIGQYSSYGNSRAPVWMNNGDGSYTAYALQLNDTVHLTGIVAFDMTGDGYLDFLQGDSDPSSTVFVFNNNGVITANAQNVINSLETYEANDGVAKSGIPNGIDFAFNHNVSVVDLNNDGITELAGQGVSTANSAWGLTTDRSSSSLYVMYHDQSGNKFTGIDQYTKVFDDDGFDDSGALTMSMSWADFNGDGYLDLYMNRGAAGGGHTDNESRIFTNNEGKLTTAPSYWFGDNNSGGTSFAVDWNLDGKMDIIEVPNNNAAGFAPKLYTNTTENGALSFDAGQNLSNSYSNITGAIVVDYDWDGTMELVLYHNAGTAAANNASSKVTSIIKNTNVAADGTSLQIRILAADGSNVFYGNTVKLYDSHGNLVSTQIINPQTSGSSNSMGLLSFYGLNASETYSVELVHSIKGVSSNYSWDNLTTGKSHDSYILTAENNTDVNNTNAAGITGTGYNDHFFGSLGNDSYNGGGGWIINASGNKEWVAKGGEDILDYSGLDAKITVDIDTGIVTKVVNVDGNYVTYIDNVVNIEKFITGSGDTVFNGGKGNDIFVGGQGDDTYNLGSAGNGSDTIYFALKNAEDVTGGNGTDTVNGFNVGKVGENASATIIDIHELLDDYTGSVGLYKDTDGYKLNGSSSELLKYLQVSSDGTNTTISIDRDGGGDHFTTLVTLHNVDTDLITLLMNNQLVI